MLLQFLIKFMCKIVKEKIGITFWLQTKKLLTEILQLLVQFSICKLYLLFLNIQNIFWIRMSLLLNQISKLLHILDLKKKKSVNCRFLCYQIVLCLVLIRKLCFKVKIIVWWKNLIFINLLKFWIKMLKSF